MSVAAGSLIGPYEVLARIGAGGMGEVWRARDPRIGRDVAIKVLPAEFARDSVRVRRFEQEARTAGSLNHPNLLTIHEFGTMGPEGSLYIVTEFLEGMSLRERLLGGARGTSPGIAAAPTVAIAPRKAIDIAAQVANGLAAAHEKGLVHRDLKPENIFLTHDGRVKILDFGLVKIASPFRDDTTLAETNPGVVVGTVGYMSPEQVSGDAVDHRSDIFSLGVVLYEMLTGQRAFRAKNPVETMNAILHEDPPPMSNAAARVSPPLERIVRCCLEKEPNLRFHSAHDLKFALEAVGEVSSASAPQIEAVEARKSRPRAWMALAAFALCAIAVALSFVVWKLARPRTDFPKFRQVTFRRGNTLSARFSRDGATIYYSAAWDGAPIDVYAVGRDGSNPRALNIPGAIVVGVSPKGELAVIRQYLDQRSMAWIGTLARVSAVGGTPREVIARVRSADWFPDGESLAVVRLVGNRWTLEAPIGKTLHTSDAGQRIVSCRVSPDGKYVAISEGSSSGPQVLILDLTGKIVATSGPVGYSFDLTWSRDGDAVIFAPAATGTIRSLGTNGKVRQLYASPGEIWLYDIALDGSYVLDLATGDLSTLVYKDGDAELDLPWMGRSAPLDITPAGDAVLFSDRVAESSSPGLYLRKLDGSPPMLLGTLSGLALAPDASAVLAMSDKDPQTLVLVPAGTGAPRALGSWSAVSGGVILPDGKSAIVLGTPRGAAGGTWRVALDKGLITPVTARALARIGPASPDSKMMAVTTIDQVPYILAFDNPEELHGIRDATRHESIVGWSQDSQAIYLVTPGYPYELYRVDLATGARTFVRRLIPRTPGVMDVTNPLVANDGKTTVCGATRVVNSNLWIADGIP